VDYTVLDIPTRVDHENLHQTRAILEQGLAGASPMVILNFAGCDYMDSSGLGLLVHTAGTGEKDVRLVDVQPRVRTILKLTRVDQILRIFSSMDSALAGA